MDGQRRNTIYPGLKVSIVLKEDQPTGQLTHGIVKDILTSAPHHPRGIKVRLTDGQIGRVQLIEVETVPGTEPNLADLSEPAEDLVVLLVQNQRGELLVHSPEDEEDGLELGYHSPLRRGSSPENAAARLLFNETGLIAETHLLYEEQVEGVIVHVFHCFVSLRGGSEWRTAEGLTELAATGKLSPLAADMLRRLIEDYELVIEDA